MKKIIGLFGMLLLFAAMQAQTTVLLNGGNALDLNVSKWYAYNYKSSVTDRLVPATANVHDTTDYILKVTNQGSGPLHFYATIRVDTLDGADTTMNVGVWYKTFDSQDYAALIAAATTAGPVAHDTTIVRTTLGVTTVRTNTTAQYTSTTASATDYFVDEVTTDTDTTTVAARTMTNAAQSMTAVDNPVLYYRYIKFRLVTLGADLQGNGIKVKRIEIQFYN